MRDIPINDLSRWNNDELNEINERVLKVISTGQFMLGPRTRDLENALTKRTNANGTVCVGNGTDALTLAFLGLQISPGDKVLTVANAGGYATGALLRLGAIPLLIDVDIKTGQMCLESLVAVLDKHPEAKAVVVTHLYGLMADIEQIHHVIQQRGIYLVEDCAQAIGASVGSLEAGSWGDASTFSFYPTKNLAGLGDGGAVAFKDAERLQRTRQLAQYGWSQRYVISETNGFNSRLDEIQASVILYRERQLDKLNEQRRLIVRQYSESIENESYFLWKDDQTYVGHLAVVIVESRDTVAENFQKQKIATGIHYPLLDHQQPAWAKHFSGVQLPNSEALVQRIMTVPCFPEMTQDEVKRVCDSLSRIS